VMKMSRRGNLILDRLAQLRRLSRTKGFAEGFSQQKLSQADHDAIRKGCEYFGLNHKNPSDVLVPSDWLVLLRLLAKAHFGTRKPDEVPALMKNDPLWVRKGPGAPKKADRK
jgi:hypothetical protein